MDNQYVVISDRGLIADPNVYQTEEEAVNALIYVYTLFRDKYNLVTNLRVIPMQEYGKFLKNMLKETEKIKL